MVPAPVIKKFLDGVKKKRPTKVPGLGVSTQSLENPLLRKRSGLKRNQSGVLVLTVEHGGSADGHIQIGDVIMKIDGHRVANNGTVQYRGKLRTRYDVVLGDHFVGDTLKLTVLREGRQKELAIELTSYVSLVPRSQYDLAPTYFIYGGLVFQPLSLDLLRTWDHWWEKAPPEFLHEYYSGTRTSGRREVVVLTQILADEINVGYDGFDYTTIRAINGKTPRDMRHFVKLVEASDGELEVRTSDHCVMAFDVAEAAAATDRILARYHVPRDRSHDLG